MVGFLQENYLVSRCMVGWFLGRELSSFQMYAWSVFWKGIIQFPFVCMVGFLEENYLVCRCMHGWFSGRELSSSQMYGWLVSWKRII